MANNFMLNVEETFNLETFSQQMKEQYQSKGYSVNVLKMKNGVKLTVEKGVGGINTLFGLGRGITATCMLHGKDKDSISVNFSEGDWTGKIVGLLVGWLLCWIPCITSIIGIIKQLGFEKQLKNDIQITLSDFE